MCIMWYARQSAPKKNPNMRKLWLWEMGEAFIGVDLNRTSVCLAKGYEVDIVCSRNVMLRMLVV
jgi:hypothetical protein